MKTFSEKQMEEEALTQAALERQETTTKQRCLAMDLLDGQDIPIHASARPTFLKELRDLVRNGMAPGLNLACDHCRTELVNHQPEMTTASIPPRMYVACPGCGWQSTMVL